MSELKKLDAKNMTDEDWDYLDDLCDVLELSKGYCKFFGVELTPELFEKLQNDYFKLIKELEEKK